MSITGRLFPKILNLSLAQRCTLSMYNLSEEHLSIQNTARRFAENELKPIASQLDKEHKFPKEQIEKLGKLGLLGINVDEKWGGAGNDTLSIAIVVEEIAKGCGGTGAIVSIHNCLYASLLNIYGTDKQKEQYLRSFTNGTLGCFALSEPEAGSDVGAISTTATECDNYFLLNGVKSWVTSGPQGRAAVIFATINKELKHKGITAFIVPNPCDGLKLGKIEDKLGIRASHTCSYYLDNVKVPKENVLGNMCDGFKMAMIQLDKARIGIAAQAIGIGQSAFETALNYAKQRRAFGKHISEFQAVKIRLAEMALKLESARLLVWRAAIVCDNDVKCTKEASMAKLAASDAATFATHNAIQILGGVGYVSDMPAERHYRDAKITEIYGGVTDIQRLLIGDLVLNDYHY